MPEPEHAGWDGDGRAVLTHREVCRSGPLDVIRRHLGTLFYPARVETLTRHADLSTSVLSAVRSKDVTVGFLRFGSEAMVDPGALGSYHVNVPLSGRVASACGTRETVATVDRGAVFTPYDHTSLPWWSADSSQLCIKISKVAVESELAALLGRPVVGGVRFELEMDLTAAAAQSWLRVVRLLVEDLDRTGGLFERSESHRSYLTKLLVSGLLHAQTHDRLDDLLRTQPPSRPRTVKRVIDLIDENPEINHSLGDLARHAGVGARRLQVAFHETLQTSPTRYQRSVKLNHARAELVTGGRTVMEVAYRWGFTHPGRFANAYRAAFGESPSETLRRA